MFSTFSTFYVKLPDGPAGPYRWWEIMGYYSQGVLQAGTQIQPQDGGEWLTVQMVMDSKPIKVSPAEGVPVKPERQGDPLEEIWKAAQAAKAAEAETIRREHNRRLCLVVGVVTLVIAALVAAMVWWRS